MTETVLELAQAQETLAKLRALEADAEAKDAQLAQAVADLEADAGDRILDAALAGDGEMARDDLAREVAEMRAASVGARSMVRALAARIKAAEHDLTWAQAAELEKRAAEADAEVKRRETKLLAMMQKISDFENQRVMLVGPGATEALKRRASAMRNAAAILRLTGRVPVDNETGTRYTF